MHTYPIKLSYDVSRYYHGEPLIPELLGKKDTPEGTVTETWEVSDYREARGKIANGPYAGRALHELVKEYPDELVGEGWRGPHFPLLEKFIDATYMLPVHLHPDDETARVKHGEPNGKTEAWHILWAEEGATILAGVKEGLGRRDLFEALQAESYDDTMYRYSVRSGDTVYVPGGVLHSFGPGALVFEVEETSDLGQIASPVDLWGNPFDEETRKANIDAVLDELRADYRPRPKPGLALEDGAANHRLVCAAGPFFALERWMLAEPYTEPSHPRRCLTLSNVGRTAVALEHAGGVETLGRAEPCILPAAVGEVRVVPGDGEANLIACYVPGLWLDVVEPLREAGHADEEIRALGEVSV